MSQPRELPPELLKLGARVLFCYGDANQIGVPPIDMFLDLTMDGAGDGSVCGVATCPPGTSVPTPQGPRPILHIPVVAAPYSSQRKPMTWRLMAKPEPAPRLTVH